MIGLSEEYEKMFLLEQRLWWYRILHGKVLAELRRRFGHRTDIRILDAGCGAGGMLVFLQEHGYTDLTGVDGSEDAVRLARRRGLNVPLIDLNRLDDFQPGVQFDAVICNDVFCYFHDPNLQHLLAALGRRIGPSGIIISNNNAFDLFRGSHDRAVGVLRRFVRADFERWAPAAGLRLESSTYWSLVLSPLILAARWWQKVQLRVGLQSPEKPASDVYFPGSFINETLYRLVRLEEKLLPRTPFGSSLFIVFER
ncbi:class I SAM-dependent DNA methyltransferase [Larkinella soli]|uniref:class I SAM-dependent DNA methyltransferase n=1 Tax=Larkinella soli TaxID=1770527 RepID=UPI000FFB7CBF|nr:class I SAM-dependent methyltransferase [Larkinella soli]